MNFVVTKLDRQLNDIFLHYILFQIFVRRCKIGILEWHAFHAVETTLFDFRENEVKFVKARAFNIINATTINILGNLFHHLEEGSFYAIDIGKSCVKPSLEYLVYQLNL